MSFERSESFPKDFEKTTEVLPFTKYGLSSMQEFKAAEKEIHHLEWLKKAGLTYEEIKLYEQSEAGILDQRKKIESNVVKERLDALYRKVEKLESETKRKEEEPCTSTQISESILNKNHHLKFYPERHPMNSIKEMGEKLFSHLKDDDMIPITKRRKILRRLERREERIQAKGNKIDISTVPNTSKVDRPGSLWDLKEMPMKKARDKIIGPEKCTMYTVKDNKIVRLELVNQESSREEFRAVDIVMPVNDAEVQLLEGTKMCVDDIKKIDRFKDYEPGIPSKVLYLKNIAPSVTQEQLSLLFNQFMLANGGPIGVHLMAGGMRGQAFVSFQSEDIAIQALEETNGTILSGRPVIAQFGRNTNRIQQNR